MLVIEKKWRFTYDEMVEVAVARITQIHTVAVVCPCCYRVQLMLSRDGGMSAKWCAAADVISRLQRGRLIDGRMDP